MAKINSKNSEFLSLAKEKTSPKIYPLLVKLVNDDKKDLAELVVKIDYLLEYTSKCIKIKDYKEAKMILKSIQERIIILEDNNINIEYIKYLYEGIKKKVP